MSTVRGQGTKELVECKLIHSNGKMFLSHHGLRHLHYSLLFQLGHSDVIAAPVVMQTLVLKWPLSPLELFIRGEISIAKNI